MIEMDYHGNDEIEPYTYASCTSVLWVSWQGFHAANTSFTGFKQTSKQRNKKQIQVIHSSDQVWLLRTNLKQIGLCTNEETQF